MSSSGENVAEQVLRIALFTLCLSRLYRTPLPTHPESLYATERIHTSYCKEHLITLISVAKNPSSSQGTLLWHHTHWFRIPVVNFVDFFFLKEIYQSMHST